jgi:hypothetical protein
MNCFNCEAKLEPVFGEETRTTSQFLDTLHIQFHLGYGEFRDQHEGQVASPQGFMCSKCATLLCLMFPNIKRLIEGG